MIIALTNSKGGVGKTTIAVHLVAWLKARGQAALLVDCDPQRSSSEWLSEAAPHLRSHLLQNLDQVLSELPRLRQEARYLVVDGPAGVDEITRAILVHADRVLVPCKAGTLEARALLRATKAIGQVHQIPGRAGKPEATIVLTMVADRFLLTQEMKEAVSALGFPLAQTMIRQRQVYAIAPGEGTTVFELGKKAALACAELEALFTELFPTLADRQRVAVAGGEFLTTGEHDEIDQRFTE